MNQLWKTLLFRTPRQLTSRPQLQYSFVNTASYNFGRKTKTIPKSQQELKERAQQNLSKDGDYGNAMKNLEMFNKLISGTDYEKKLDSMIERQLASGRSMEDILKDPLRDMDMNESGEVEQFEGMQLFDPSKIKLEDDLVQSFEELMKQKMEDPKMKEMSEELMQQLGQDASSLGDENPFNLFKQMAQQQDNEQNDDEDDEDAELNEEELKEMMEFEKASAKGGQAQLVNNQQHNNEMQDQSQIKRQIKDIHQQEKAGASQIEEAAKNIFKKK